MASIQIQPSKDTIISSIVPTANYGSSSILQVYYYTDGTVERRIRTLLSFDIPSLETVTGVNLWFYQYTSPSHYIDIHILQKDFVEMESTWNKASNIDQWITPGGDYDTNPIVNFTSKAGWNSVSIPASLIPIGFSVTINLLLKFRDETSSKNSQIISKDSTPTYPIIGADLLKPYLEINTDVPCPSLSTTMEVV